jgi:hypothetical protein
MAGGNIYNESGDNEEEVDAKGSQRDAGWHTLLPAKGKDAYLTYAVRIYDEEGGQASQHLYGLQVHWLCYLCMQQTNI